MVIIRRKPKDEFFSVAASLNFPVSRLVKGEVGLEIECEGNSFRKDDLHKPWTYHKDGSLRGKDNAEYVFATPQMFRDVPRYVDSLWSMFKKDGTILDDSNRTSVHVHLNVQEFYLNRLASLMALWIILEEPLAEWCGDHRVGNLFCLRAKDAPAVVNTIARFIASDMGAALSDSLHYSGMNPQAIVKLGSLEFRTLRGATEPGVIKQWVSILERLYHLSADYPDPRELCEVFSHTGPIEFFERLLGPSAGLVRDGITMGNDQLREAMYDGVRLAQDLCYCRDWDRFKAIRLKPDPFGRDLKQVKRRLDGETEPGAQAMDEINWGEEVVIHPAHMNQVNFNPQWVPPEWEEI